MTRAPEKKAIGAKAYFPVLPVVMVSCRGTGPGADRDNVITVGRVTPLTTAPPRLVISIRKSAFSYAQIVESGEFVINHVHEELLLACDRCGIVSGRGHDKFAENGLTPEAMEGLKYARAIGESRLSLGCRLDAEIGFYEGYAVLIGEVVSVSADERVLDEGGNPVAALVGAVGFDAVGSAYLRRGEAIGTYGYGAHTE
jgi:flavin reductase (DIM6/NTAB) family NADH-FMN oxidoreductase RutF